MFSAAWFAKHQRVLLTLLALPVVGRLFRWLLRIRRHDVGYRQRIVEIGPHYYTVENPDGTLTSDFRTHEKYGKRLFYGLLPVWRLLHAWDMVVANPFVPAMNLGFDTLTVYPDPGNPGATTCDGRTYRNPGEETWAGIISSAGTSADVAEAIARCLSFASGATTNLWSSNLNAWFLFDTSSIRDGTVTAATVSLCDVGSKSDPLSVSPSLNIFGGTTASNTSLATADYATRGTTAYSTAITWAALTTSGSYNDWTLNSTGRAAISTTGVSKFSARNSYDYTAVAPTWAASIETAWYCYYADQTGTTNDPKLVVTYTMPGSFQRNRLRPRIYAPGRAR